MYLYSRRSHNIPNIHPSLSLSLSSFLLWHQAAGGSLQDTCREPRMETPIKLREGKSSTRLGFGQPIRAVLRLLLPAIVFTIILSYPYWPPCPSAKNLSHPLLNSLPALLDRRFMFLLCNVILVFISGNSFLVIQELPSKKKPDVYDVYVSKKNEFSVAQMRNMAVEPKSTAAKMGSQRTCVDVLKEKKEVDAERESEARVAAEGGEEQLILEGPEREEEEEHFVEQDRRFDEFIARKYENWRREQQQLATEFQRKKKVENHERGLVFSGN